MKLANRWPGRSVCRRPNKSDDRDEKGGSVKIT